MTTPPEHSHFAYSNSPSESTLIPSSFQPGPTSHVPHYALPPSTHHHSPPSTPSNHSVPSIHSVHSKHSPSSQHSSVLPPLVASSSSSSSDASHPPSPPKQQVPPNFSHDAHGGEPGEIASLLANADEAHPRKPVHVSNVGFPRLSPVLEVLMILQAMAALAYLLVFRIKHESRYRASFVCIEIVFIVLVKLFVPPAIARGQSVNRWAAVHIVFTNLVFAINTLCSLIVLCVLDTVTGESGDLFAWNFVALEISIFLWFDWPWTFYPCLVRCGSTQEASASGGGGFTGSAPRSSCSLRTVCCITFAVPFFLIVELLLLAFLFTSYGAISRTYHFVNHYAGDRTSIQYNGVETSLHATCFYEGRPQPVGEVHQAREVYILEAGLGSPVEIYYSFMQDLSLNLPKGAVCSVSRPGYGWSDAIPLSTLNKPFLPSDTCHFLAAWITKNNIPNVTLIGHEFGGLQIAQLHAYYPSLVRGLIFIDSFRFSRSVYQRANYQFFLPDYAIQLYGLEGVLAFLCDIMQLPKILNGSQLDYLNPDLQYSLAIQFLHTQMLETSIRDNRNLVASLNQANRFCSNYPTPVPISWITSRPDSGDFDPFVCLNPWSKRFTRVGLDASTSLRLFLNQRAILIEKITTPTT